MYISVYHGYIFSCAHYRCKFVAELEDIYLDPSCPSRRRFNSDFVDPDDMVVRILLMTFTPFNVRLFNIYKTFFALMAFFFVVDVLCPV